MSYPPQPSGFSQPSAPGGGDSFVPADHNGALLLVYPKSFVDASKTKHGDTASAEVDVIVVDRPGPDGRPQSFIGARFFGNLAKTVRNDLGGQVLGRLGQGPNTQGSPPWILLNFTDQEAAQAGPAHAAYQQGQFKATTPPMQAPAPSAPPAQQWQQPPAAAPAPQQWQTPAPQAAPAPAPQAPPTAQQWQAPAAPVAAPTPVATPPASIDPNLVQFLAGHGITIPPGATQADAEAIANSLPR